MSVAVVIPVFNGARFLDATLASVRAQERVPERILVVDDQSTDDSAALARAHPGVEVITNPDKGAVRARNVGIREAGTDFVAMLDQDDLWHPAHLRLALDALSADPICPAVFGTVVSFADGDVPLLEDAPADFTVIDPWARFPTHSPVRSSSAAVMRTSALQRVGSYDPAHTGAGDFLVWLKLALLGPLGCVAAPTVGRREHPDSQVKTLRRDGARYLDIHLGATAEALAWRRGKTVEDLDRLTHRQEVAVAVRQIVGVILAGHDADEPSRVLEALLDDGDDALLHDVFHLLVRTLVPAPDPATYREERFALLQRLHAGWPRGAPSRRALLRYAARKGWPVGRFVGALGRLEGVTLAYLLRLLLRKLTPRPA